MDKAKNILIDLNSPDETVEFARELGEKLRGGEIIELAGDIGSGKTTFVRGLAAGAGSKDHVTSPTFTVQQIYRGRVDICHYDFYRLEEGGILSHELHETAGDKDLAVVVEWAGTIKDVLPANRVRIEFIPTGSESRKLSLALPKNMEYLA